jgi:hypothetical protein
VSDGIYSVICISLYAQRDGWRQKLQLAFTIFRIVNCTLIYAGTCIYLDKVHDDFMKACVFPIQNF